MRSYYLLMVFIPASALIVEDVFPPSLAECYSGQVDKNTTPYDVQTSCLEKFLGHMYKNTSSIDLGKDAFDWFDSLGRKLHIRLRRQSRYSLRVRKEIRTLSQTELINFFDAVNALKNDKSVKPNKYDSFAIMHQGDVGASAHDGPNFVSWHRYFLVLFENALREKNSRVTLPYWDSRADYLMTNKEDSILFTEFFLGNAKGVVYTGPFAFWSTPTNPSTLLRREIGVVGSPVHPERLKTVFTKKYHREILRTSTPDSSYANLESHHDNVHRWVGGNTGQMSSIIFSPMDPVFWLLHCFVDYLWEQFRENQKKLGINSETDYPATTITAHKPNRLMDNLKPPKKNIDGYSNSFTRQIYRYADAPTCDNNCGKAFRGFLYCDRSKKGCVSGSRFDFIKFGGFSHVTNYYPSKGKGRKTQIPLSMSKLQSAPAPSMAADNSIRSGTILAFEGPENKILSATESAPKSTTLFRTHFDNTAARARRSADFSLIGNSFKIGFDINLRLKQEMKNLSSLNSASYQFDNLAFSPIAIINRHNRYRYPGQDGTKNQRTFNITFQTEGFSYNGRHIDFISIDERTHTSESVGLIMFEKPVSGETKTYVRVYDSNGVMCQPSCLVSKSSYKECSGMIKITSDYPRMYVDSYNEAFHSEITPFLKFICVN
ncbi:tyrosinase-like protein [Mytilus galloprovincialis]|uniref:tyrosinase-like protein n=1 Tax=Mytilus galloprovincialis TaxID=29158 RepID=UPI003F7CAF92